MIEVFDLHADIGFDVMQKRKKGMRHILQKYHIEKLRKGGISFVCMASNFEGSESWSDMQAMILALKDEIHQCEEVDLVVTKDDLLRDNGHIKAILTVEGMCGIKDDAEAKIEWLYQQGVRIASLCWNDENALASGVRGNPEHGLHDMGKKVIEKMIALKMGIDVSHANEKTFWDIMEYENAFVMATHSNARRLCDHARNLWDEQIQAVKEHQGIIGIVSAPPFVATQKAEQDIAHMVAHIQYIIGQIGIEHVALGLDYMDFYPSCEELHIAQLNDASYTQKLVEGMLQAGMDEQSVRMITLGNALRMMMELL